MKNSLSYKFIFLAALMLICRTDNSFASSPFGGDEVIEIEEVSNSDSKESTNVGNKSESFLSKLGKGLKDGYSGVTNKASDVKDAVVSKASNAKEAISDGYSSVKSKVSSALSKNKSYINESIFLPGHESKEMVCQGIAYLPYKIMDANEQIKCGYCRYILLSYYPKNSSQPSQIVVVDRRTAKAVKRFALYKTNGDAYTGHAGGIAVAGKYLWVASGNKIYGFDAQEIIDFIVDTSKKASAVDGLPKSMDVLPAKKLTAVKTYSVDSKASYVSFDGKYLWVGDFTKSSASSYKPVKHHKIMGRNCWIAGYLVDSDGYPTSKTQYTYTSGDDKYTVNKPDAVIAMRESVQGMAVCGNYVALTVSYGAANSKLAIYNNPLKTDSESITYKPEGQSNSFTVKAWELEDKKNWVNTVKLAAGAEDLEYDGENLYVTFECSSKNYKTKWSLNPLVKITNDFYLINPEKVASAK